MGHRIHTNSSWQLGAWQLNPEHCAHHHAPPTALEPTLLALDPHPSSRQETETYCYPESCRHKTGISECSPRFAALFSAQGGHCRLLLPLPVTVRACLELTRSRPTRWPVRGLVRPCKRTSMPNRLNVGMYARLSLPFQIRKCPHLAGICYPMAAKSTVWPSGDTGAGALAFCYARNVKGLQ